MSKKCTCVLAALLALSTPATALAQTPAGPTPAQKSNYSLPMLMRPAAAPTLVRLDTTVAMQEKVTTVIPVLTAAYRLSPEFSVFGRAAMVQQSQESGPAPTAMANPFVFAQYVRSLTPAIKLVFMGGTSIPAGAGGGNKPNAVNRATVGAGIYGRQAMDNAMYAVNYLTPTGGLGLAYIRNGWTAQADLTVLQLLRVRGDQVDTDERRTNFTAAAHLGYRATELLTFGVEAHYQRWLSTPAAVEKNGDLREQATVGGNVRFNVPFGEGLLMRPSIGYFMPVDRPMTDSDYRIVQLDFPVLF